MARADGSTVSSRWWYVIALVPVVAIAGVVLGVLSLRSAGWVDRTIEPFVYLAVIVLFAHPVALYFDARALRRAEATWRPDPVIYVAGAVLGITFPILSPLVAVVYLFKRFESTSA